MRGGRGKSVKGFLKDFFLTVSSFGGSLKIPNTLKDLFQVSCE